MRKVKTIRPDGFAKESKADSTWALSLWLVPPAENGNNAVLSSQYWASAGYLLHAGFSGYWEDILAQRCPILHLEKVSLLDGWMIAFIQLTHFLYIIFIRKVL